jgi:cyclophilin family peptidyl-prolyl cis-trans isomerase/HEAT repeat protein
MRALTAPLADSSSVGSARAFTALLAATRDTSHAVSVNAVRSLGSHRTPASIARLREVLGGDDAYLAITAAEALGRLGAVAPQAGQDLRAVALNRAKPIFLRTTALAALAEILPGDAMPVADSLAAEGGWRARSAAARVHAAARNWDAVAAFARESDGRVAAAAIEAAAGAVGSGVASIRPLLVGALEHPDPIVRTNALNALATLGDPSTGTLALDAYQRAQGDSLNDAALAAVDVLAALYRREPSIADAFHTRFARSGDYLVRQRVATAFGNAELSRWGAPLPIETRRSIDDYRAIVRRTMQRPTRRARIVTERGTIELELFAADAPLTVESFLSLAARGFFNGQEWPRVVPNFVVQGGDPRGDTSGGPGYAIRDEINRHPFLSGTLGMALSGPDTGGSQWFLTHSPQPHLDGGYTVFGRAARGMDVVDRVLPGDRILRIEEVR